MLKQLSPNQHCSILSSRSYSTAFYLSRTSKKSIFSASKSWRGENIFKVIGILTHFLKVQACSSVGILIYRRGQKLIISRIFNSCLSVFINSTFSIKVLVNRLLSVAGSESCNCSIFCTNNNFLRGWKCRKVLLILLWKQNLPLICAISDVFFFQPDVSQLRSRQHMGFLCTSERAIIFLPNCNKFAVECDWSRKNSQNVQNLGFFGNIDGFFLKKKVENFSKSLLVANFFQHASQMVFDLENVFPPYLWGFFGQNQEKFKLEQLENMMKKQCILKKNALILLKSIFKQCFWAQNFLEVAGCLVLSIIKLMTCYSSRLEFFQRSFSGQVFLQPQIFWKLFFFCTIIDFFLHLFSGN